MVGVSPTVRSGVVVMNRRSTSGTDSPASSSSEKPRPRRAATRSSAPTLHHDRVDRLRVRDARARSHPASPRSAARTARRKRRLPTLQPGQPVAATPSSARARRRRCAGNRWARTGTTRPATARCRRRPASRAAGRAAPPNDTDGDMTPAATPRAPSATRSGAADGSRGAAAA